MHFDQEFEVLEFKVLQFELEYKIENGESKSILKTSTLCFN